MKLKKLARNLAIVSTLSVVALPVLAGGVIGDFIEVMCEECGLGAMLDGVNANAGKPVEKAVAGALESVAPGAGAAYLLYDKHKGSFTPKRAPQARQSHASERSQPKTSGYSDGSFAYNFNSVNLQEEPRQRNARPVPQNNYRVTERYYESYDSFDDTHYTAENVLYESDLGGVTFQSDL